MRVHEAKNFLVQEIAIEAQLEGAPLSNLERRMLYFTESEDATEDPAALNEQFEKEYDTAEYEKKISRLMSHANRRSKKDSSEKLRLWNEAIHVLRKGDHYILVFLETARNEKIMAKLAVPSDWYPWRTGPLFTLHIPVRIQSQFKTRRTLANRQIYSTVELFGPARAPAYFRTNNRSYLLPQVCLKPCQLVVATR